MKIAFIGLGRMGGPIARRLIAAGHELAVHDVREEAGRPHVELGGRFARTRADACADAQLVLTCLPGPPEVESAVYGPDGILEACRPGTVYADLSSNAVSLVRRIHASFAERDCPVLDAPVSGGVTGAQNGTLQIMVGGSRAVFDRIQPVLVACGKLSHMGEIGSGTVAKLTHNLAYTGTREFFAGIAGGQENAFLHGQSFIDGLTLQLPRNEKTDQIGNHQGHDDRIIPGHLKDHDHGCERCAHDTRE